MTFQFIHFVKWTALLCLWRWGALLSLPWARLWATLPRGRTTRPPSTTTWPWCWLNSSMTAALWSERYRGCWMLELDKEIFTVFYSLNQKCFLQSFSLDLILIQQQKKWDGVSFWLKSTCKTSPSFSYKHFFFYRTMIDERIKKVKCFALAHTSLEGLPFFNDVSDLWL